MITQSYPRPDGMPVPRPLASERGFTLPELLIALVITVLVSGAALSAIVHAQRNALGANALTDLNQNLRVSINLVVRDLLQTGFDIPVGGIAFPTGALTDDVYRPGPTGSELTFDDTWVAIPAVTPGNGLGPNVNGVATDIVTVLRSDTRLPWGQMPVVTVAANGQSVTFPADFAIDDDVDGIKAGDLIMLSNAAGNTLMEVTDTDGQKVFFGSEAESKLNQHNAPAGSISALRQGGVYIGVVARRVLMVTYYLDDSGEAPALMRRINYGEDRKIAVGVENLQLTWDLVDGEDNPSNLDEPEPPNTPHEIRKANLHMAARTFDRSSTGKYFRSNLNTQVALRSLAFVDRYK